MASNVNVDLSKYFKSPEAFKPLQAKIEIIYKRGILQKKANSELSILKDLVELPFDPEQFSQRLKELLEVHTPAKIYDIAREALFRQAAPPILPPRLARAKSPKNQPAVFSNICLLLQDEAAFSILLKKANYMWKNRIKYQEWELSIVSQIKAAGRMLAGNHPFTKTMDACLSDKALQQAIHDVEVPANMTKSVLLEFFLKKIDAEPMDDEDDWKATISRKPAIHARSHTQYLEHLNSIYPAQVVISDTFRKMVEGTVIMKFIFPEFYEKVFFNDLRKLTADALLDMYLTEQLCDANHTASLKKWLAPMLEIDSIEVEALFRKLLSKQTLTAVSKPPEKPKDGPMPQGFLKPPFDEPQGIKQFIKLIGFVKYTCPSHFEYNYSKMQKMLANQLLHVFLLMEFLHFPFERAVRYVIAHFEAISDETIAQFVQKVQPQGNDPVYMLISGYLPFTHVDLFDYMILYIKAVLPNIQSQKALKIVPILMALDERIKHSHISLEKAIRDTFNLHAFIPICHSEDPDEITQFLDEALRPLMPILKLEHKYISTEIWFEKLKEAAIKFKATPDMPIQYSIIQERLISIVEIAKESSMNWSQIIYYYFNHEALRALLNEINDAKNSEITKAAFEAIMGQAI